MGKEPAVQGRERRTPLAMCLPTLFHGSTAAGQGQGDEGAIRCQPQDPYRL